MRVDREWKRRVKEMEKEMKMRNEMERKMIDRFVASNAENNKLFLSLYLAYREH